MTMPSVGDFKRGLEFYRLQHRHLAAFSPFRIPRTLMIRRPKGLWAMKRSDRSFAFVSILYAALLLSSTGTLNARDADLASLTFAAAQTSKQCVNTCRARYRDCLSLKQIPPSECRGVYQDCIRNTCNARPAGRPAWPGFPM